MILKIYTQNMVDNHMMVNIIITKIGTILILDQISTMLNFK